MRGGGQKNVITWGDREVINKYTNSHYETQHALVMPDGCTETGRYVISSSIIVPNGQGTPDSLGMMGPKDDFGTAVVSGDVSRSGFAAFLPSGAKSLPCLLLPCSGTRF